MSSNKVLAVRGEGARGAVGAPARELGRGEPAPSAARVALHVEDVRRDRLLRLVEARGPELPAARGLVEAQVEADARRAQRAEGLALPLAAAIALAEHHRARPELARRHRRGLARIEARERTAVRDEGGEEIVRGHHREALRA